MRGGREAVVLKKDGLRPIPVSNYQRTEPIEPYLIDQIAHGLGKSKQEVREEASRM